MRQKTFSELGKRTSDDMEGKELLENDAERLAQDEAEVERDAARWAAEGTVPTSKDDGAAAAVSGDIASTGEATETRGVAGTEPGVAAGRGKLLPRYPPGRATPSQPLATTAEVDGADAPVAEATAGAGSAAAKQGVAGTKTWASGGRGRPLARVSSGPTRLPAPMATATDASAGLLGAKASVGAAEGGISKRKGASQSRPGAAVGGEAAGQAVTDQAVERRKKREAAAQAELEAYKVRMREAGMRVARRIQVAGGGGRMEPEEGGRGVAQVGHAVEGAEAGVVAGGAEAAAPVAMEAEAVASRPNSALVVK